MSARPGQVRETVELAMPQPRAGTGEATALVNRLRATLEEMPAEETIR
jgi:hypothetical protein